MLIALSGGTAAERKELAESLRADSRGGLVLHEQERPGMPSATNRCSPATVSTLRAGLLAEILSGRSPRNALILVHCLAEQEADLVRAQGGSVWHLYGEPSRHVVIRKGDPIVSRLRGVPGHVVEPLEAYSQMVLAKRAGRHV
jgi:hypothetical protein